MFLKLKKEILDILENTPKYKYDETTSKYMEIVGKIIEYRDNGGEGKPLYDFLAALFDEIVDNGWTAREGCLDNILELINPNYGNPDHTIVFYDLK